MAIFGFHFVLTLITATVFSKVTSRLLICDWTVFRGLYYYLLEGSLLPAAPKNESNKDFKRRINIQKQMDENERLLRIPLSANVLQGVPMFGSLVWMFNYFIFAIFVYLISDLFTLIFPLNQDRNTSLIWLLCALLLFIQVLCKLTVVKFSSQELNDERNTIICFASVFYLISMIFVMFSDNFMDVEFQKGYQIFIKSLDKFLASQGYTNIFADMTSGNTQLSPLLFLIVLSLLFTMVGAIFLFPNIQYASWYLRVCEDCPKSISKFSIQMAFFLPLLVFLMFTKPVKSHFMANTRISNSAFDALRIVLIILWALFRCGTNKIHLQAFLDLPLMKIVELKQNSQLKAKERQKKIAYYTSYFCAATLQYFAPVFIILSTALLLKSFGGIQFSSLNHWSTETTYTSPIPQDTAAFAVQIFLLTEIQKSFWTLCLIAFLGIQSGLCIIGVISQRISLSQS